uniref:Succinate dehydrogenase cytochrome b560 subunit, mitochondrial n=1 Tax=Callorhinchus milii TaxID=7868 RepID=K4FXV3_CALMI|nr:succinate dehydrogenase complex subunit C isoform 1 precursor [Callorhinchus milii]
MELIRCRQIFTRIRTHQIPALYFRPNVTRMTTSSKEETKSFEEKNIQLNRPLSPHLTIYGWSIPMAMSISHRMTGAGLATGLSLFSLSALVVPGDFETKLEFVRSLQLAPSLLFSAKFVLSLPLTYHTFNGIRHLVWDSGKGLTLKDMSISGLAILGGSVTFALILANL